MEVVFSQYIKKGFYRLVCVLQQFLLKNSVLLKQKITMFNAKTPASMFNVITTDPYTCTKHSAKSHTNYSRILVN